MGKPRESVFGANPWLPPPRQLGVFALWLHRQATASEENALLAIRDNAVVRTAVIFIAAMGLLFGVLVHLSVRRWERAERACRENAP